MMMYMYIEKESLKLTLPCIVITSIVKVTWKSFYFLFLCVRSIHCEKMLRASIENVSSVVSYQFVQFDMKKVLL